jgi:hypothetical protein
VPSELFPLAASPSHDTPSSPPEKAPTHLVIATVTFQLALASSFAAVLESVRVTCMTSSMYCLCSVALGAGIVKARQSCGRLSK